MTLPLLVPRSQVAFAPAALGALASCALKPGLVFLHGHEQSSRLAHYFLAAPLARGETVLFLDAANCFDPFKVAKFARRCGREPKEFLARVRVSRAFTCFQMAELVERVPEAARPCLPQAGVRTRCVVLTGFPDIFDDEEIPAAQARAAFARIRPHFRLWSALQLRALAFSDRAAHLTPLRKWLMQQLSRWAAEVYRLEEGPAGLRLREERDRGKNLPQRTHPSASPRVAGLRSGSPLGCASLRENAEERREMRIRPEARALLPVVADSIEGEI
ncbi:MAG: hypothetical protein ACRD4U_03390 [Candidatus Acidiferrales bacterium]